MNTANKLKKYYARSAGSLHSFCWDEQCAVYHVESGDTHLLTMPDLKVLQFINETPLSINDLTVEFESLLGDGADQYLEVLLSNLSTLGLVETIYSEAAH